MARKTAEHAHVLVTKIAARVSGRKRPIHVAGFVDMDPTKLPSSKIASEIAAAWKAAKSDGKMATKPVTISIRLTPKMV